MKRNEFNRTKYTTEFNDRRKNVYTTMIYPKIDRHVTDIYIDILQSDRLDNLAYKYYNDVTLWWIIAEANKLGKGSLFVKPGKRIRLPHPDMVPEIIGKYHEKINNRL